MPFPNLTTGRTDRLVTNVLLAYKNPQFIASEILPEVPGLVDETGLIGKISNHHLRQYTSKRAVYDESQHRMEFKYTQDDRYNIDYYDLEIYIPDRVGSQLQQPFNSRRDSAFVLQQALMLEREVALATAMHDTAVLTNNVTLSGTSQFDDYANSVPEQKIETARDSVFDTTGLEANAIYMSRKVANTLKSHPFFLDLMKRNAGGNVANISLSQFVTLLKEYFEFEYVNIGRAIKVTSMEGQTETKGSVWSNDVVVYRRASNPSLYEPSFGYCFTLAGMNKRFDVRRQEADLGDINRVMWAYQDKILDANCAYLIKDAV